MRVKSTPSSAEAMEPSLLAITETLATSAIVGLFLFAGGSLEWLLLPTLATPFLLLRTNFSSRASRDCLVAIQRCRSVFTTKTYEKLFRYLYLINLKNDRIDKVLLRVLPWFVCKLIGILTAALFYYAFAFFTARIWGTLTGLLNHPLKSIASIPGNWWRVCLCTDFFHPPEVIPGVEHMSPRLRNAINVHTYRDFSRHRSVHERNDIYGKKTEVTKSDWFIFASFCTTTFTFWWLPTYFYRLSLKATALILLPLAMAARASYTWQSNVAEHLDDIVDGKFDQAKRLLAAVIVFVAFSSLATPILIPFLKISYGSWIKSLAHPQILSFLHAYYVPLSSGAVRINGWHVAQVINGTITLAMLYYADITRRSLQREKVQANSVRYQLSAIFCVQYSLTVYTYACGILILDQLLRGSTLIPNIDFRFLP